SRTPSLPPTLTAQHGCGDADSVARPIEYQRKALACLVNKTRAFYGLRGLRPHAGLNDAAARKAKRIGACGRFTHTPCGDPVVREVRRVGYRATASENLFAAGGTPRASPMSAFVAWMQSPPHRANMLAPGWRSQGFAMRRSVRLDGHVYAALWVQKFGAQ
ncbi:MAG: CAP domain-containing protein, partial [Thermoleophilia bacterium]